MTLRELSARPLREQVLEAVKDAEVARARYVAGLIDVYEFQAAVSLAVMALDPGIGVEDFKAELKRIVAECTPEAERL